MPQTEQPNHALKLWVHKKTQTLKLLQRTSSASTLISDGLLITFSAT